MVKDVHYYLDDLLDQGEFCFKRLALNGIENRPGIKRPEVLEEEVCLFHREVETGDDYLTSCHAFVQDCLVQARPGPVVRFADGEFAFYAYDLRCNGLYKQAESVRAIRKAMPYHEEALKVLGETGKLAPLIYTGNIRPQRRLLKDILRGRQRAGPGREFIQFLKERRISFSGGNYLPFFVVYAYLTSRIFRQSLDDRSLCILNSECDLDLCRRWFSSAGSHPRISYVKIPADYVATRWEGMKRDVLGSIPRHSHLCLVGAGIGALQVCVDISRRFSIPAIDAGHVLNMMNGLEEKSAGPRLFTVWADLC